MRLGLRDQEAGQLAVVAGIWDIDRRKSALVTVLTKSRRRTCGSRGKAQEGSACRVSRTRWHVSAGDAPEGATRGWFGGIAGKTIGGRFLGLGLKTWGVVWWLSPENHRWRVSGFGPQNPGACGARRFPGLGLKTWAEVPKRTGRHMATSVGLRQGEAIGVVARWPLI